MIIVLLGSTVCGCCIDHAAPEALSALLVCHLVIDVSHLLGHVWRLLALLRLYEAVSVVVHSLLHQIVQVLPSALLSRIMAEHRDRLITGRGAVRSCAIRRGRRPELLQITVQRLGLGLCLGFLQLALDSFLLFLLEPILAQFLISFSSLLLGIYWNLTVTPVVRAAHKPTLIDRNRQFSPVTRQLDIVADHGTEQAILLSFLVVSGGLLFAARADQDIVLLCVHAHMLEELGWVAQHHFLLPLFVVAFDPDDTREELSSLILDCRFEFVSPTALLRQLRGEILNRTRDRRIFIR